MATCEGRLQFGLFLATTFLLLLLSGRGAAGTSPVGLGARRPPRAPATSWKRDQEPPSYLSWVPFEGQLPPDAVSSWNGHHQRLEYVCATEERGCNTGAHVPERGPFCFFPYAGWEVSTLNFKLLVNVGGFEVLDWVDGSFGSVPENAVEGCPRVDIFVGRNRYGLGKVSKEQRALFVVEDGEEVWYKWYQVLMVRKGPADATISDLRYNMSAAVERGEDVTLTKTTVRNEGCQGAREAVTLKEDTEVEHDWKMDQKIFATIHGTLRAGLPVFKGTSWEVANGTNIPWAGAASAGEYVTHARVVEELLQPRTACTVAMEGRRLDILVPFSAQLSREFGDGRVHRVAGTGWARSRAVVGVRAGVKECWPLPDLPPCWA